LIVNTSGKAAGGRVAPGFALEKLFETARTVMGRRGQVFERPWNNCIESSTTRPDSNANALSIEWTWRDGIILTNGRLPAYDAIDDSPKFVG
jgi:hypothetical protein